MSQLTGEHIADIRLAFWRAVQGSTVATADAAIEVGVRAVLEAETAALHKRIAELETRIEAADRFLANATLVTENDRLREELRKALARNVNANHITERLQWVLQACEIDRDARAELEALLPESEVA